MERECLYVFRSFVECSHDTARMYALLFVEMRSGCDCICVCCIGWFCFAVCVYAFFFFGSVFPRFCRTVHVCMRASEREREIFLTLMATKIIHITHTQTHKHARRSSCVAVGIMWKSAVIMHRILAGKSIFRALDMPFEPLATVILQCNRKTICFFFPSFCRWYLICYLLKQTNVYLFSSFAFITVWLFS